MTKLTLNEVSYLIANGQSLEKIAEQSGWSIESLQQIKRSKIYEDELNSDQWLDEVESAVDERLDTELSHVRESRQFTDDYDPWSDAYQREDGDPQELDFNEY